VVALLAAPGPTHPKDLASVLSALPIIRRGSLNRTCLGAGAALLRMWGPGVGDHSRSNGDPRRVVEVGHRMRDIAPRSRSSR
jgi:hypothetical protein